MAIANIKLSKQQVINYLEKTLPDGEFYEMQENAKLKSSVSMTDGITVKEKIKGVTDFVINCDTRGQYGC